MNENMETFVKGLGLFGLVLFVFVVIAVLLAWWWVIWIVAGIVIYYIGYTGPYVFALQIFIWVILIVVTEKLGSIGTKKTFK